MAHRSDPDMKLSARNVFEGKVVSVVRGQTTAHVKIEIAPGKVVTSSITVEAVDDLGLKPGDAYSAGFLVCSAMWHGDNRLRPLMFDSGGILAQALQPG